MVWLYSHSKLPETIDRCRELMMALSFFPWSGNNIPVENITALFSDSPPKCYLASFHTDYMVRQMSNQYQELHGLKASGHHIFANMDTFKTIVEFYGSPHGPVKTGNPLWERLAGIENRIVMREVDSVGGVHYLPLHWVSVVFDIQQGCILYGDSLGR